VANLWRMDARTRSLEVDDWTASTRRTLTFTKDPKVEIEEAFKKARRLRRGSAKIAELVAASDARADELRRAFDENDADLARRLGVEVGDSSSSADKSTKNGAHATTNAKGRRSSAWTGRTFEAPASGAKILVGRNRRENDYVSCVLAKDGDLWFHARGAAGAHVLLQLSKLRKDDVFRTEHHPDDLQAAADAAAFYSDSKMDTKVDVTIALPKHVLKPPNASPGAVTLREEHATIVAVPERHRPRHDEHVGGAGSDEEADSGSSSPKRPRTKRRRT